MTTATKPARSGESSGGDRGRLEVVGVSERDTCGVRDHANLLSAAMDAAGYRVDTRWLTRSQPSLIDGWREIRRWARRIDAAITNGRADAVILHYSAFAYSYRGMPIFARPVVSTVARSRRPVLTVLHEFAYPWVGTGWRGAAWATTQRMELIDVMRASTAVIVTTESRAQWLASRKWLPRRQIRVAPVFSNLPAPNRHPSAQSSQPALGMFGYSFENVAVGPVLDALKLLKQEGNQVTLRLLGAPGRSSEVGDAWAAAAAARGVADAIEFSGVLPAQTLSDALASCDILLFADRAGPASRNGTLAASLASGVPLVALDGPDGWPALRESGAARVVAPASPVLAETIRNLLGDTQQRDGLGANGRAFAEEELSIGRTARIIMDLLEQT